MKVFLTFIQLFSLALVATSLHSAEKKVIPEKEDFTNKTSNNPNELLLTKLLERFGSSANVHRVGLTNQGNTCYQNSILQAMDKCTPLQRLLKKALDDYSESITTSGIAPTSPFHPFATSLQAVLLQLQGTAPATYNPADFAQRTYGGLFGNSKDQQDADEFFTRLWEKLQDPTLNIIPNSTPLPGVLIAERLNQWSGISITRKLKCMTCDSHRTSPPMPEYTCKFSLEIPAMTEALTLQSLLNSFSIEEDLDAVECVPCAARTAHKASMQFAIAQEQSFAVVQLKRFSFDWTTFESKKIQTPMTFDPSGAVTITDSLGETHNFVIASVVVHRGALQTGHYWTVTPTGVYDDERLTLDEGVAMRELLTTGCHTQNGHQGEGYIYFLQRAK